MLNHLEDTVGADNFTYTAKGDPGTTGRFEVVVNDELVHSKATLGHGKAESAAEKAAIVAAITKALA